MNLDFACTRCGKCCEGLWLPLSLDEARAWLHDGYRVDLLCEAIPWPSEPSSPSPGAAHQRARSFPARSGALPVRVRVTLAAPQGRRCPQLSAEGLCQIYERRPAACQIYPAEVHPLRPMTPSQRLCPPEAWASGGPAFMREAAYVDPALARLTRQVNQRPVDEVDALQALCTALGVRVAAQASEGYVVHMPDPARLLGALSPAAAPGPGEPALPPAVDAWQLVSARAATSEILRECGADLADPATLAAQGCRLLDTQG